ncbi:protein kinase, partial [bacterium]|nr:protein kinase [bacterium]
MSVTTNQIIDGYKILRTDIGRGGWGVVHLAQDSKGNKVALKFLDRENLLKHCRMEAVHREGVTVETIEDEVSKLFGDKVETFKSEYQNIKKFSHPNVARAYSFGFFGDQFYIASEYVEGRPLARTCRDLKPDEMVPLFIQSLLGLEAIHKHGLLHLDIKSANILVTGDGR